MTKDEAIKMAKAKLECLERNTSGLWENCNNDCENCDLNYDQGNMGEQKEWLKFAIKAMEQEPIYFPPCVDCNTKMNEIREAYDKLKDQVPCDDAVSRRAVKEGMIKYRFHASDMTVTEFVEDELQSIAPTLLDCEDFVSKKEVEQLFSPYFDKETNVMKKLHSLQPVTPTRTEYEVIEDFISWCKGRYGFDDETGEMYESEYGEEWGLKQVFEEYKREREDEE